MENLKEVDLYTDGACSYNPGPGGWGCVLIYKGTEKQLSGFEDNTTNNRMELMAVIKGLNQLKEKCKVNIYTDSAYVFNAFNEKWIDNWIANGWKNSQKKPVLNYELWQELLSALKNQEVVWNKVKGHADNKYNNICDKLATSEVEKFLQSKQNS